MNFIYLFYFLLSAVLFFGAQGSRRGEWNEEYTSLKQTKAVLGFTALGVGLHHMAQKTCAPWHPRNVIVPGLDVFVDMGFLFVAMFFFCSGLGLYKSYKSKPDYLKGFFRRRVLPLVIAYYLSEIIYLIVRLVMGQKMDAVEILWYLSGLHMANGNAWYLIVIPFFYAAFYLAFRYCKRDGAAIAWVFLFTLLYTLLCASIDHQNDWWIQGEWWYNSVILFPLGMLFAKHEKRVTAFFKKGYWFYLAFFFAAAIASFLLSKQATDQWWGYSGETWGDRMKIPHRLLSACAKWLACVNSVSFWFVLTLKVKLGNKVLAWLGTVTLEFYLIHGMFVEMFGYNFMDFAKSLVYIRYVPLYVLTVLACAVPATILFRLLLKGACNLAGTKH